MTIQYQMGTTDKQRAADLIVEAEEVVGGFYFDVNSKGTWATGPLADLMAIKDASCSNWTAIQIDEVVSPPRRRLRNYCESCQNSTGRRRRCKWCWRLVCTDCVSGSLSGRCKECR